jgi:hypothetical protein
MSNQSSFTALRRLDHLHRSLAPNGVETSGALYAPPREVSSIADCHFYCVADIPGHGTVGEAWDLRGKEQEYLGGVSFRGKRVLELGTASGFLCRWMESQGADVVGYDLSEKQSWDLVPCAKFDLATITAARKRVIKRINDSWWFCHRIFRSRARVVYGTVYEIPKEIGLVDIATVTSILLHLRDPFYALQNAARLTRESLIVTDVHPFQGTPGQGNAPVQQFLPNFRSDDIDICDRWWLLYPETIIEFMGILGFENTSVTYHTQNSKNNGSCVFYTIVGKRTRPLGNA